MKLVLFDIDGILIPAGSIKFDYWKVILKKHFDLDVNKEDIYTEGMTDREILAEYLKEKGIKNPEKDKRFSIAIADIGNVVLEGIKETKFEEVPNVENFIRALLDREDIVIGLLTGNVYEKAKSKLEKVDFWKYFKIGAFGHEATKRSELVPIAIRDAKKKTGIDFKKEDVYLIGDTVADIRCAKEAGVKIIAVATGKESSEQLEMQNPDYLFKDFSDIEKIITSIR